MCDYLDIAPKFQFEEIVAAPDRLDDHLLSAFISHHPSGLDVLAASRSRFHARDLGVEALSALFDRMAQRYSTIVIDLPLSVHPGRSAARSVEGNPGHRAQHHSRLETDRGDASRACARKPRSPPTCERSSTDAISASSARWRAPIMWRGFSVKKSAFASGTPPVAVECVNVGSPIALAYPSDKSVKDIAAIAAFCAKLNPAPRRSIG